MPSGRYKRAARSEESDLSDDDAAKDHAAQETSLYLAREKSRRTTYLVIAGVILLLAGIAVVGFFVGRRFWGGDGGSDDASDSSSPQSVSTATVTVELAQSVKVIATPTLAVSEESVQSQDRAFLRDAHDDTDVGPEVEPKTRASSNRYTSSETQSPASRSSSGSSSRTRSTIKPEQTDAGTSKPAGTKPSSTTSSTPEGATPLNIDFNTFSGSDVEGFLNDNGLEISKYPVGVKPISHTFLAENVDIVDGALRLKVDGDAKATDVKSSEIATAAKNILYGSMTTRAKSSPVAGVCHGFFFYLDDDAEIDIEILTSYITKGLENGIPPGLEFTNHGKNDKSTNKVWPYPFDPAEDFHDYTINWTPGHVSFLVDGEEVEVIDTNVPDRAGAWIWNSWSSGDPQWSAGPPSEDNWLLIEAITGYYTTGKSE